VRFKNKKALLLQETCAMQRVSTFNNGSWIVISVHCIKADVNVKLQRINK